MRRLPLLIFLLCLAFASLLPAMQPDQAAKAAAQAAAERWLALVDAGRYGESWTEAAPMFKSAVSEAQWEQAIRSTRAPLGAVLSRKLARSTYTHQVPGAPDGEYVILQYDTSFQNKKNAVETVTPMLDKNGVWRVSGYYIR